MDSFINASRSRRQIPSKRISIPNLESEEGEMGYGQDEFDEVVGIDDS